MGGLLHYVLLDWKEISMSNHVATITKDEGRCSFSRKALSVFMAVLLAFLMMPMVPAESAWAAHADQDEWDKAEIAYSVDADQYGRYVTDKAHPMLVESVVDVFGDELSAISALSHSS